MASGGDGYTRLRDAILTGRYLPNERLVEADLVQTLGVSRAAARIAIVRLAHEGLVEHTPNRGAKVRLVDEREAAEILEARAALEGVAARKAAANAGPEDVAGLRTILAAMRERRESGDLLGASEHNARLHATIMRLADHATTERLVSSLNAQIVRHQYRTILIAGRPEHSFAEHAAIVDAIAAGDGAAAEAAMRAHLMNVGEALGRVAGAMDAA